MPRNPTLERSVKIEAAKVARHTSARNDRIRELLAAGYSLREVGALADLSHSAVAKIQRQPSAPVATVGQS